MENEASRKNFNDVSVKMFITICDANNIFSLILVSVCS